MSMAGFLPIAAVSLIVAAVGGSVLVVSTEAAHASKAAEGIANLEQGQVFADANADQFAVSIEDLTAVLAQAPAAGATLSYVVNSDRSGYVLAAALPNGVLFGSDTHARGNYIKCEAYTAECVAKVTDDPELIEAAPVWTKF